MAPCLIFKGIHLYVCIIYKEGGDSTYTKNGNCGGPYPKFWAKSRRARKPKSPVRYIYVRII